MADDDAIEAALRRAVPPVVGEGPSLARVGALRAAVEADRIGVHARGAPSPAPPRRRWRVGALVAAAAAVAFAAGVALRAGGTEGESSDLAAARAELERLGSALAVATAADVDGTPDAAQFDAVAAADAAMVGLVDELDPDDKAAFVPVAHQVHLRAVALFDAHDRTLPSASEDDLAEIDAPTGD